MKTAILAALTLLFSTHAMASEDIYRCARTETVGRAHVNRPGFAQKMRNLRALCARMERTHEAAAVVWSQYDRAYECKVGYYCNRDWR